MTEPAPLAPSNDLHLLPAASKTFRIIANRYQFFVLVAASANARDIICGGVPYVESFQTSYVAWCHGNALTDTDTTMRPSFRTMCSLREFAVTASNSWQVSASLHLVSPTGGPRSQGLIVPTGQTDTAGANSDNTGRLWHNDEAFKIPARICYGVGAADNAVERGQLWDAVVVTQEYTNDLNPIVFDNRNWYNVTMHGVESSVSIGLPSLLVVIP